MSNLCRCAPPDRSDCPIHGPVPRPDTNRFETPPDTVFVAWTGTKGFYADPDGSFVRRSEYLRLQTECLRAVAQLQAVRQSLQALRDDLLVREVDRPARAGITVDDPNWLPDSRTLSADEFEQLALMGVTSDGTLRLGDGAAERMLATARRLTDAEVDAFLAETPPALDPARTARIRARFFELLDAEMKTRSQTLYDRWAKQYPEKRPVGGPPRDADPDFPLPQRLVGPEE